MRAIGGEAAGLVVCRWKQSAFKWFTCSLHRCIPSLKNSRLRDLQTDHVACRQAESQLCIIKHTLKHMQGRRGNRTRRQKWVRLTSSVSLRLKNATGSRCFALDTMDAKARAHSYTQFRRISVYSQTSKPKNVSVFTPEEKTFTFECGTHSHLHIYLFPLLRHTNTPRSCTFSQMQSTNSFAHA